MPPSGKKICTQSEYFTTCNCVFNFNFLAPVVSKIIGGPKFKLKGPAPYGRPLAEKILTCAQVLAYTYITVKFQHRSSINVRLTEGSLYNENLYSPHNSDSSIINTKLYNKNTKKINLIRT